MMSENYLAYDLLMATYNNFLRRIDICDLTNYIENFVVSILYSNWQLKRKHEKQI